VLTFQAALAVLVRAAVFFPLLAVVKPGERAEGKKEPSEEEVKENAVSATRVPGLGVSVNAVRVLSSR
jgi:hypothetical protein